jgi:hypothetical protein
VAHGRKPRRNRDRGSRLAPSDGDHGLLQMSCSEAVGGLGVSRRWVWVTGPDASRAAGPRNHRLQRQAVLCATPYWLVIARGSTRGLLCPLRVRRRHRDCVLSEIASCPTSRRSSPLPSPVRGEHPRQRPVQARAAGVSVAFSSSSRLPCTEKSSRQRPEPCDVLVIASFGDPRSRRRDRQLMG